MKLNRREFVATGAAAFLPLALPRAAAAQAGRHLVIVAHGLSVIAIKRPAGTSGLPASTTRADLLFVENAQHEVPKFFFSGTADSIDLAKAELQVLVNGKPLPAGAVTITNRAVSSCPKNQDWESMTLIPDFEQILGKGGVPATVGLDPACLNAKAPRLVQARMTFEQGTLAGSVPQYSYTGQKWNFPNGNSKYESHFTDTLEWAVPIGAKDTVTFQGVDFATGKVIKTLTAPPSSSNIVAQINAQPKTAQPNTNDVPHFVHYYDLLTYGGTPKQRPIPTKTASTGCNPPFFTTDQERFKQNLMETKLRFQKSMQDFEDEQNQADCGGSDGGAVMMRSEPGICVSGIVYT